MRLDDTWQTPADEKKPCPRCGSMRRTYVITVGATVELNEAVELPDAKGTVSHTVDAVIADGRFDRLKPFARKVVWTNMPEGTWMVEVKDENDVVLDSGLGDDREDALLDLAEHLMPPEPPRSPSP
jgi:hypothetical protein